MANVGKESMMGAGDAAKEFLEQEKERLEKRKRNLEVQLKTIIDHRKYLSEESVHCSYRHSDFYDLIPL